MRLRKYAFTPQKSPVIRDIKLTTVVVEAIIHNTFQVFTSDPHHVLSSDLALWQCYLIPWAADVAVSSWCEHQECKVSPGTETTAALRWTGDTDSILSLPCRCCNEFLPVLPQGTWTPAFLAFCENSMHRKSISATFPPVVPCWRELRLLDHVFWTILQLLSPAVLLSFASVHLKQWSPVLPYLHQRGLGTVK